MGNVVKRRRFDFFMLYQQIFAVLNLLEIQMLSSKKFLMLFT